MSWGNSRQRIFRDDADRQNLLDGLEDTVVRYGWELFAFVFMPNHLLFRTPRPHLARGMQRMLSTCTNRYARQHRRPGHLFHGRFKGELIEDEGYFWSVNRYIHLNPVRGPILPFANDRPSGETPTHQRPPPQKRCRAVRSMLNKSG